jgi:hypothetical protein
MDVGSTWGVDDRRQLDDRTNRQLDEQLAPGEPVRVIIKYGPNGSLVATDRRVFICKQLVHDGGFGKKDVLASWDLSELTGIVFEQDLNWGHVILVGPGLPEVVVSRKLSLRDETLRLNRIPNVLRVQGTKLPLMFRMDQNDLADRVSRVRALISAAKAAHFSPPPAAAFDPLDQLRKLGELRDAGIITMAEFDAKKVDLLRRA